MKICTVVQKHGDRRELGIQKSFICVIQRREGVFLKHNLCRGQVHYRFNTGVLVPHRFSFVKRLPQPAAWNRHEHVFYRYFQIDNSRNSVVFRPQEYDKFEVVRNQSRD